MGATWNRGPPVDEDVDSIEKLRVFRRSRGLRQTGTCSDHFIEPGKAPNGPDPIRQNGGLSLEEGERRLTKRSKMPQKQMK